MGRKQLKVDVQNKQELANRMLEKSRRDLDEFQGVKAVVREALNRVRELNQDNNFSSRMALAYRGVDR